MKINKKQYIFEKTYNPQRFNILFDVNDNNDSLIHDNYKTKYFLPDMFNGVAEVLRVEEYITNSTFIVLMSIPQIEVFKGWMTKTNNTIVIIKKHRSDYVFKQMYFDNIIHLNDNNDAQESKIVFIESANNPFAIAH